MLLAVSAKRATVLQLMSVCVCPLHILYGRSQDCTPCQLTVARLYPVSADGHKTVPPCQLTVTRLYPVLADGHKIVPLCQLTITSIIHLFSMAILKEWLAVSL